MASDAMTSMTSSFSSSISDLCYYSLLFESGPACLGVVVFPTHYDLFLEGLNAQPLSLALHFLFEAFVLDVALSVLSVTFLVSSSILVGRFTLNVRV